MLVICETTAEFYAHKRATLTLTQEDAKRLLTYRAVWEQAAKHNANLYCLEFFNYEVTYGERFKNVDMEDEGGSWYYAASDPGLVDNYSRTTAETLKVTRDGVLWSAAPKHGNSYFETPKISWQELESVAAGGQPFVEAVLVEGAAEPGE